MFQQNTTKVKSLTDLSNNQRSGYRPLLAKKDGPTPWLLPCLSKTDQNTYHACLVFAILLFQLIHASWLKHRYSQRKSTSANYI
ncbi:hypothetical protein BREVNS_0916 [Brevinematales bacterium NS]|nr:hypothetical protein BREVNS_0916 [Brevinematales bacterium NS]